MKEQVQIGCPHCLKPGTLTKPGNGKCRPCQGIGYIGLPDHTCAHCQGSGSCRICDGAGWISN